MAGRVEVTMVCTSSSVLRRPIASSNSARASSISVRRRENSRARTNTPWDVGHVLARAHPWPFPDGAATQSFTTKRIAFEGGYVLGVIHDKDGEWQFLDGEDLTSDDCVVVHLEHVVGAHADVAELGDLARGWEAWRETPTSAWIRHMSAMDEP